MQVMRHGAVLGPAYDEFLRFRIEVSIAEWRRINGIKQSPQLTYMHLNDSTLGRNRVTS